MQYKGDATCEIENSLCVMHNIMRTMILEQDDETSRYHISSLLMLKHKWKQEARSKDKKKQVSVNSSSAGALFVHTGDNDALQ